MTALAFGGPSASRSLQIPASFLSSHGPLPQSPADASFSYTRARSAPCSVGKKVGRNLKAMLHAAPKDNAARLRDEAPPIERQLALSSMRRSRRPSALNMWPRYLDNGLRIGRRRSFMHDCASGERRAQNPRAPEKLKDYLTTANYTYAGRHPTTHSRPQVREVSLRRVYLRHKRGKTGCDDCNATDCHSPCCAVQTACMNWSMCHLSRT